MARSLRVRLLAGAALAILAALVIAWLAMTVLFERHVRRQVEAELGERGIGLIAKLSVTPTGQVDIEAPTSDPRFNRPASGLYWQISGEGVLLRSRSLWDGALTAPAATGAAWTSAVAPGPHETRVLIVARRVQLDRATPPLIVALASDFTRIDAARNDFGRELALFLVLLWAALAAAAWLQVTLGLRPLEDMRAALRSLRQSAAERLPQRDLPTEVAPLANAINELAEARERDLERARQRAGDLAHSLKTPLSALNAQSRRAREAGAADAADGLDRAISAATRAVEHELARARAATSRGNGANARGVAARLIQVVERTESGARLSFENVAPAWLPVDENILFEILGPLLENAARFAQTKVRIAGDAQSVRVEDDGPGLSEDEAARVLRRGASLDERGEGHGLGLAIANELAEASGAELSLRRSDLGGLLVDLRWRA